MNRTTPTYIRLIKGHMLKHLPGMISCAEFEQFIDSYLDGTLSPQQLTVFERHLKICRECRVYLDAYKNALLLSKSVCKVTGDNDRSLNEVPTELLLSILDSKREGHGPK